MVNKRVGNAVLGCNLKNDTMISVHCVGFEIATKYCISDSFVDYNGYSISSEGFLPTVVDIMVI